MLKNIRTYWRNNMPPLSFLLACALLGALASIGYFSLVLFANAGEAPKVYPGPYVAYVQPDGVYDGDTINVEIHTAPGQILMTGLRVEGVDTPELSRSGCVTPQKVLLEKKLGKQAKEFVKKRYPDGLKIRISNLEFDKFGGRHVGIVERETMTGWQRLDDELLRRGLADPYGSRKAKDPLKKTKSWCTGE